MTWIRHSSEIDERKKTFSTMSHEEYDKYMCEKYPDIFKERHLPLTQTCMCWSFDIGRGWYWILDELCENLEFIKGQSGISVYFTQIKEKFGGARFYYGTTIMGDKRDLEDKNDKCWIDIIEKTINYSEELCDYYCAECGEDKSDMISVGGWVYDLCEKCLKKDRPAALKVWIEYNDLKGKLIDLARYGNKEEIKQMKKLIKEFENRRKKEYEKQQKQYEKSKKETKEEIKKIIEK